MALSYRLSLPLAALLSFCLGSCTRSGFGSDDTGLRADAGPGGGDGHVVGDLRPGDGDVGDGSGDSLAGDAGPPHASFSDITATGPVPADGVSASTITITIRDENNLPVSGVTPTFAVSGAGNTVQQACSASDHAGVSTCARALRSTIRQVKTLSIVTPAAKSGGTVEFITIPIFRSVGPKNETALATGSGKLVVSGSVATFEAPLPDNVGVGDLLQYSVDGDASTDAIAFVHGRVSSRVFEVRDKRGLAAASTSGSAGRWSVFRAYTTLYDAGRGNENPAIDAAFANFDSWSPGNDLVAAQRSWHVACYADALDTRRARITEWNTGPDTYLRVFTPWRPSEVGASQRHRGAWTTGAYRLETVASGEYHHGLLTDQAYVRIDGLQVRVSGLATIENGGITVTGPLTDNSDGRVSNNIVRGEFESGAGNGAGIWMAARGGRGTIWNNVVSGWNQSPWRCIYGRGVRSCVANNTVYDCFHGFGGFDGGAIVFKNNISFGNRRDDYYWHLDPSSSHNASRDGTAPGSNAIALSSDDPQAYFYGSGDFRPNPIAPQVGEIIDVGLDLSSDNACARVADDNVGTARPQGVGFDLGASELVP